MADPKAGAMKSAEEKDVVLNGFKNTPAPCKSKDNNQQQLHGRRRGV